MQNRDDPTVADEAAKLATYKIEDFPSLLRSIVNDVVNLAMVLVKL